MFGQRHHFISYSTAEAQQFAYQLHDALEGGPPKIPAWLDKRDLKAGVDWDSQIAEGIRDCDSLLFVMTPDSVTDASGCKLEWSLALKYKKPVVPLLMMKCDAPFRLQNRQYIDFSSDFASGIARLRDHLRWLASPEGELQRLKDQLMDAERDLRRATDSVELTRIQNEIAHLKKTIEQQDNIVRNPEAAAQRTEQSIERGLERERQPEKPLSGEQRSKFINPPPGIAPDYFQNRHIETKMVADFLLHERQRMITIVGRGGVGKTAMVCRLLKGLESGKLPDDLPTIPVNGIVYLSEAGTRRATVANLFSDLGKLLPKETAAELDDIYRNPQLATESKVRMLLEAFPDGRIVLLLDNFEDMLDDNRTIKDAELDEALKTFLNAPPHAVKVIITTRVAPRNLLMVHPERQRIPPLELDKGLESPFAENVLREMDSEDTLGLKTAPAAILKNASERVRGYPRALEALVAALAADRESTLDDILKVAEKQLPDNVTQALVGEAFNRLDPAARKVMQTLGAYGRPIPEVAVDYLLQPFIAGINSAPILGRLVNMHFARREAGRYYLHPVDRQYALSLVSKGEESDRFEAGIPPFSQIALFNRGAEYFASIRKPREDWKTLEDLRPHLDEFDLRCEAGDWETAAGMLADITVDYLLTWGFYRLVIELHHRLLGNLSDHKSELTILMQLSIAYAISGRINQAFKYSEQAHVIAQANNDEVELTAVRSIVGAYYWLFGRFDDALETGKQDLEYAQNTGDLAEIGRANNFLGMCYSTMGNVSLALDYFMEGIRIKQELKNVSGEADNSLDVAEIYIDSGDYSQAEEICNRVIPLTLELNDVEMRSRAYYFSTLAHLYRHQLADARTAADMNIQNDVPLYNPTVFLVRGIVALRQQDVKVAHEMFVDVVAKANDLLTDTPQHYSALDAKGLALCGLALTAASGTDHPPKDYVEQAKATYRTARAITKASGVVGRVLRLFDALAVVDTAAILKDVRAAAAGEE